MKESIIFTLFFLLTLSACQSKNIDLKLTKYKVQHTIKLEENDTSFVSNVSNIEFFENNNILLNSSGNGIVLIFDYYTGKIVNSISLPIQIMDTLKFLYEKNKLSQPDEKKIYSYNELFDIITNLSENKSKNVIIQKIDDYYKRRIRESRIINADSIIHLCSVEFLLYSYYYKENLIQELSMVLSSNKGLIFNYFLPKFMTDLNGDPYFPTFHHFETNNSFTKFYLNTFNELYERKKVTEQLEQTNHTTAIQNEDYSIMELKIPLPNEYTKYGLNYNFANTKYININDEVYCTFQLIDSIYNVNTNKTFPLFIGSSNNHFFQNYLTDDKEFTNFKRVGFITDALSKNKSNNLIISTKIFEDYENDNGKATKLLLQEYDGKTFELIRSTYVPFIYKNEEGKIFNVKLIEANPLKENSFAIIYTDMENYYIDFCEW